MEITDTHSHIYLEEFAGDRKEMLKRAELEGVRKILMPAIDSETHEHVLETERSYSGKCFAMMGLHPCSVKTNFKEELSLVKKSLAQ